jgi:hypothetical protein
MALFMAEFTYKALPSHLAHSLETRFWSTSYLTIATGFSALTLHQEKSMASKLNMRASFLGGSGADLAADIVISVVQR